MYYVQFYDITNNNYSHNNNLRHSYLVQNAEKFGFRGEVGLGEGGNVNTFLLCPTGKFSGILWYFFGQSNLIV